MVGRQTDRQADGMISSDKKILTGRWNKTVVFRDRERERDRESERERER